jgi:uncharacterized membrane protein YraQ (UPF0718 family)
MKSGLIMLIIVILIYIILYLSGSDNVLLALNYSFKSLKKLSFVFVMVFVMMFLIDMFVDDKKISRYFNTAKGIRAYLIAMIAGVLSHGSSYAWYPLLQSLREKGVKDSLIITFFICKKYKNSLDSNDDCIFRHRFYGSIDNIYYDSFANPGINCQKIF